MGTYRDIAVKELELLGYTNNINSRRYSEINASMAESVLELLGVFSKQGHSGMSASYCLGLFNKLANQEPLTPLTGEDSEWNDVTQHGTEPSYQNNRCSHVFKDSDGRAYDIDGILLQIRIAEYILSFPILHIQNMLMLLIMNK